MKPGRQKADRAKRAWGPFVGACGNSFAYVYHFLSCSFDPLVKKRNNDVSREKQEMAKLNHKLKREKKAAKKDLRADAAFLAKQKAKEKRLKDEERTRKTKAILGGLGGQEGEYRQMQRQKKKKKF